MHSWVSKRNESFAFCWQIFTVSWPNDITECCRKLTRQKQLTLLVECSSLWTTFKLILATGKRVTAENLLMKIPFRNRLPSSLTIVKRLLNALFEFLSFSPLRPRYRPHFNVDRPLNTLNFNSTRPLTARAGFTGGALHLSFRI